MTGQIDRIKTNFSSAVSYYDNHATLQKVTAERLFEALKPWQYSLPDGSVIEIGAGTGFFTRHLLELYKNRQITISDLSEEMVQYCQRKFGDRDQVKFQVLNAEDTDWSAEEYALIVGNYVPQWFKDPGKTLSDISNSLKPGGLMLVSFPTKDSFPNWRKYCLDLGLPFTVNNLPDLEKVVINLSMGPVKVDYYEDDTTEVFDNVYTFFKHLKQSGTSTNISGKQLSYKQLKLLNDYWIEQTGGKIKVTYHTAFIAVKRDLES